MALPAVLLAKLAAAAVSNEGMRRKAGWIVAAILSPFIVTLTLFCSLLSGGAEHNPNAITVAVTAKSEPEDTERITWLYLPMAQVEIDRALLRAGITDPANARLRLESSQLPDEVNVLLDMEREPLSVLNELAEATDGLSEADMQKLGAAVMLAKPENAAQIKKLAENLNLFDFAPGAHTPEEYGKYMIQQSGRFEYDENLSEYYDYEKYGFQRMDEEDGMFTDRGYIAYNGYFSMEEVMEGRHSHHMEMGGLS